MSKLFNLLEGLIQANGDFIKDRVVVDAALNVDEVMSYAEGSGEEISRDDAHRICVAGRKWVADVNDGNGEWSRMRFEAIAALED